MKEVLRHNLNKVKDLEDRKLLKEILFHVFNGMVDYSEQTYGRISEEVAKQAAVRNHIPDISMTICEAAEYDETDMVFYPLIVSDTHPTAPLLKDLMEQLESRGECFVAKTFLTVPTSEIATLLEEDTAYTGTLVTETHRYEVKVKVTKANRYWEEVKKFHQNYKKNGLEWRTLNTSYLHKFVEMHLVELKDIPTGDALDEQVVRLEVNLGEYEQARHDDIIPLWNIETVILQSDNFPIATEDHEHYNHRIELKSDEDSWNYLIQFGEEFDPDGYLLRNKNLIDLVLEKEYENVYKLYRISALEKEYTNEYDQAAVTNAVLPAFMNELANMGNKVIRTKAEVIRKLLSYEAARGLVIDDVTVMSDRPEHVIATYNMNPDAEESLHMATAYLMVSFHKKTEEMVEEYLLEDQVSFLLSELSQYFPEYHMAAREGQGQR